MSKASSVDDLKRAILSKAQVIASEYNLRAIQSRDNILQEARERLHLREQRETQIGKHIAGKEYARRIQANELKLHRKLDILRWSLVESVITLLKNQFITLRETDQENYIVVLGEWTAEACELLGHDELVAELNSDDHQLMKDNWADFTKRYVPDAVHLTLADATCETLGGVRICTLDNTARVDNCFEGRMQRLEAQIQQTIMQRLFSTVEQLQRLIHD